WPRDWSSDVCSSDLGERRPKAPEHVVAAEPPPTDIEEHRADRVRYVEIVVHPEEILLDLGLPADRERLVSQKLAEDLLCHSHGRVLQGVSSETADTRLRVIDDRSWYRATGWCGCHEPGCLTPRPPRRTTLSRRPTAGLRRATKPPASSA